MPVFSFSDREAKSVGDAIGIDFSQVDLQEFKDGLGEELSEHGALDPETNVIGFDLEKAGKIAWEHLKENPHYYTTMKKVEGRVDILVQVAQALSKMEHPHEKERYYRDFLRRKRLLDRVEENEGEVSKEAFEVLTSGVAEPVKEVLLEHYTKDGEHKAQMQRRPQPMAPSRRRPKTNLSTDYATQVKTEVENVMASIQLRSFRVGQNVYHPNFGTRGKVIEVDRDTLHIQEKDDDGNLLERYRVVPKEAFEAWESED